MFEKEGVLTKLVGAFQCHRRKDSTFHVRDFLDWPADTRTSTVTFSCNKMHRRFDQPHYPPKQIFVSDKMAEQPELISDNLLEKVLLCDQCVESDVKENCLHSRITQEEPDSID